jgi:predicted ester cyclase
MRRKLPGGIMDVVDPVKKAGWQGENETPMTAKEEKNKALVRRFLEARVMGDVHAVGEMLAPNFVNNTKVLPDEEPGREGFMQAIAQYTAAFSNSSVLVEDQVAAGDKVVTRCVVRRTHDRGEVMGVAPSGRELTYMPVVIHRIEKGKIAEQWGGGTGLSELRGLGLEQSERERERVEQELLVARRIQHASLPKEVPKLERWQIASYYQPAREVGGDFYDFQFLSEGKLGLAIGDATGKGVPAALVMSTTCGMLRLAAQSYSSPGEILQRVNQALFPNIPPNMFVTCFYTILDPKRGSFTYANAGHDLPYVQQSNGEAEELRARGMPLGLMPGMSYEEKEIVLDAGDGALFYSDGLVEAHNPKGEMFGFPRLQALIVEHGEDRSLGDFLLEELYSFVGEGWEQEDDITLLTLRHSQTRS